MLIVEKLCASYKKHDVLCDLSFQIKPGEIMSVLGPNGAGKSTLIKSLCWIRKPTSGKVVIDGHNIQQLSRKQRARLIGYVPQQSEAAQVSVRESILLGRTPYFNFGPNRSDHEKTNQIIQMLGLENLIKRQSNQISGGELQQAVIARALAQEPKVLLLDEPSNHLDIKNRIEVMSVLKQVTRELGICTLMVVHDLNFALQFCDQMLMLRDGYIVSLIKKSMITPEIIEKTFSIKASLYEIEGCQQLIVHAQFN